MEHRHGTRYLLERPVRISAMNGPLTSSGVVSDVSISGCFIRTALPASPLIRVVVRFISQGHVPTEVIAEGQLIRRTASGVGVEWFEYQSELVRQLALYPGDASIEPIAAVDAFPRVISKDR